MSLPPGFLDELRSRASLSHVVGRKVIWDARKSNQGKGDMWAPCPFHQEKTASFHVDDRKGFYYCFGCHAKGDAISFVQQTENVGFMEAVEILAREAGMPMPARDPKAQEKTDRRAELAEVMEQALRFFRLQLKTGAAAAARDYLARRGLSPEAQDRWELGFAPDAWQGLWDHLRGKGVAEDLILGAGLAKPSAKGGRPYDVFRGRIIFPIRDARGRCIAFGGRAMDPADPAKYLNSPETLLFDKGRSLYNHGPARAAAGNGQPLIVAEGYMDVIALSEAGFTAAVAPLGTAITETQLQLIWRIAPEPIIALDGDKAGIGAALRLIDLAAPMVRLLWQRETEGQNFDSPERKAALDKALRDRIRLIRDPSIRAHYGQEIKNLRWQLFAPPRGPRKGQWRGGKPPPQPAMPWTKSSPLAASGDAAPDRLRAAVILASVLATPQVIGEFESGLETMVCVDPEHGRLRDLILRHAGDPPETLAIRISEAMGPAALENLHASRHVAISPCVRHPGDLDLARMTLAQELAKLQAQRGLSAEIEEAAEEMTGSAGEAVTWRLAQAAEARNRALRSVTEDRTEYDTGANGARINRNERSRLDALLEGIRFDKSRET